MKIEERLIVAADFNPRKCDVKKELSNLISGMSGTGVYIKINSILRLYGYELIREIHEAGLKVFADLKLHDIPNTMWTDAEFLLLDGYTPDMLTVMASSGVDAMTRVQAKLPNTKVLGVTVLTSLDEEECQSIYSCSTKAGVLRFARMAQLAKLQGLILSPREVPIIRKREKEFDLELVTPGIRPKWCLVAGDDQTRVLTPGMAIENGSDRIVIGRPIVQSDSPRDAIMRTLDEIAKAIEHVES